MSEDLGHPPVCSGASGGPPLDVTPSGSFVAPMNNDAAAKYIGVGPDWLYKNRVKAGVPHHRFGKKIVFRAADLDRWLAAQIIQPKK